MLIRPRPEISAERDLHVAKPPHGSGLVLWTARRVQFDRLNTCSCGAPRKIVSERAILAVQVLPDWSLVDILCAAGCSITGVNVPLSV